MNYDDVKSAVTMTAEVPDGFDGSPMLIGLAWINGELWEVDARGCYVGIQGGPDYENRYSNMNLLSNSR